MGCQETLLSKSRGIRWLLYFLGRGKEGVVGIRVEVKVLAVLAVFW